MPRLSSCRTLLVCVATLILQTPGWTQGITPQFTEPLSPRIANYNIDVRLDEASKQLHGKEVLIWKNTSNETIDELQYHLYLNGFRNTQSTYMLGTGTERFNLKKDNWGYIEVTRFLASIPGPWTSDAEPLFPDVWSKSIAAHDDLTTDLYFIQPDDDNENDKSVFAVPLHRPIPPGLAIALYLEFRAKLPEPPIARTGATKEYVMAGQWFPKIGVYLDGSWNCHQFNSRTNFFADFGVYNVRMTVPEANVVGATGQLVSTEKNNDGTVTHFYRAEDVHDFAWTTSPEFREFYSESRGVRIRALMQPDHVGRERRYLDAADLAIRYFEDWYGDYPFPNLTLVDPRRGARASGGMEYPTLITLGTTYGSPAGLRLEEHVTIHEFGHNFWYHLLASNEFEEAWLDEGVNTYTDFQIMDDAYGTVGNTMDLLGIKLNIQQLHRAQYINLADRDPIARPTWEFYSGSSYSTNSYGKTGLVLTTLQNYLGWDTMREAMRAYVARWRFKHPHGRDFFAVIEEIAGQDLNWFFDQAFHSTAVLDYAVSSASTREKKAAKGYDYTLDVVNDSSMTNGHGEETHAETQTRLFESIVKVRRIGDFRFPVEIEVVFADGERVHERWDGEGYWTQFTYERPAKLLYATVDPEGKIPIDVNFTNNSRAVQAKKIGINKLSARWMFWMQFLLDQPEFISLPAAGMMAITN